MQLTNRWWKTFTILLALMLGACGGGGSGAGPAASVDSTPPAVTLTAVASPTALSSQLLSGTVEAGATVSVTLMPAGLTGIATVTGGGWVFALTGVQSGGNTLSIVARDAAGNTSLPVIANIVFDAQAPVLTLSPPPARTNAGSLLLSGTVNEAALVEIASTGGGSIIGTVIYPTATTWEVAVTGLAEGNHGFSVTGTDGAGNMSALITVTVVQDSVSPTVMVGAETPLAETTGVSLLDSVSFKFSEAINVASVNMTTIQVVDPLGDVPGDISTIDGQTYTFTPSAGYDVDAFVQVTVTQGVTDLTGNPLAQQESWRFRTANSPPPPPPF